MPIHTSFLQVPCLFHWRSKIQNQSVLVLPFVYVVCFLYPATPSIFFGLTSRQTGTRDICVPCFCMALKECTRRRILGVHVQHKSEKEKLCCFLINSINMGSDSYHLLVIINRLSLAFFYFKTENKSALSSRVSLG
jgi:hypothetical protein